MTEVYAPKCFHPGSEQYGHLSAYTHFYGAGHYQFSVPRCCLDWYLRNDFKIKQPWYWKEQNPGKQYPTTDVFWINVERHDTEKPNEM